MWDVGNITNSGVITTDGKLFTVTINTLGATANAVYALKVFAVDPADGPFDSVYSNDQVIGVTFAGSNGSFQMVPEPSSIALGLFAVAGLGVVAIRRRRARA